MDVPSDIMIKMERYCAFQERCEQEVRNKLRETPISTAQRDEIVRRLKEHDFLNEQRFIETFIRSKLHDQWGKLKIREGLYQKGADSSLLQEAINAIDEEEYAQVLQGAIEKWKRLHPADADNRNKILHGLLTKGFEVGEILQALQR